MAVVAMDRNRLIGSQGQLPWRLPADLRRFREVTTPWPVVMGRITWESIGRPLPNRRNVVISRQSGFVADGAEVVESIEEALALCADSERTMIIGGAAIYAAAWPSLTHLHLTQVHGEFDGDTWLRSYVAEHWAEEEKTEYPADEKNAWACTVRMLVRRA